MTNEILMKKDGDSIIVKIKNADKKAENAVLSLMNKITEINLNIEPVKNTNRIEETNEDIKLEDKKPSKEEYLIKTGTYKGLTVRTALNNTKDMALYELMKIAKETKDNVLVNEIKVVIKERFSKIEPDKMVDKFNKNSCEYFIKTYYPIVANTINLLLKEYEVKSLPELFEKVNEMTLKDICYSIITKIKSI